MNDTARKMTIMANQIANDVRSDLYKAYLLGVNKGKADEQEFVEKKCNELGIDFTLIFTCDKGE